MTPGCKGSSWNLKDASLLYFQGFGYSEFLSDELKLENIIRDRHRSKMLVLRKFRWRKWTAETLESTKMTRPIDVHQLLKSRSAGPKYMSVEERERVVIEHSNDEVDLGVEYAKKRNVDEVAEDSARESRKKSKPLDFDWDPADNTLEGYQPIVNPVILERIRQQEDQSDGLEAQYLGKSWREKMLVEMDERDWRIMREEFNITSKGKGAVKHPLRNWSETNVIPSDLVRALTEGMGFDEPTAIQRITIPNAISSNKSVPRDILGIASTGSGKTLAFSIPILARLDALPARPVNLKTLDGPLALVLVPTRELAQQISQEINRLLSAWENKKNLNAVSIVGGHSMSDISHTLRNGCDILIATPGRLLDVLDNHLVVLNKIQSLVLDEADRMIDLGFEDQMKSILSHLMADELAARQTMLFTATLSSSVESIAKGYLKNPLHVSVGSRWDSDKPLITQVVRHTGDDDKKLSFLKDDLIKNGLPAIIFINYKETADWLTLRLSDRFNIVTLHGSKSQSQRESAIQKLKSGTADVLIATNVAARGLDIPDVALVVNFQMSKKFDDYIHRIGRTGRAGKTGIAVTYLTGEEDPQLIKQLAKYVKDVDPNNENDFPEECAKHFGIVSETRNRIIY